MTSYSEKIYLNSPIWLQNVFVSLYGVKLWQKRYCGDFKNIINLIKSLQYADKKVINELKISKLKGMLEYCNDNIPYYKELFMKNKIDVNKFKSLTDLDFIPILEKETLRNNPEAFIPADYLKRKYVIQKTSGTTGTPLSIFVDKYTYQLAMALLVVHEETHDIKMGDKRATFAGKMVQEIDNNKPPFWRFNMAENQMLFSSYHLSDTNMPSYIDKLNRFKPKEIIGYPSSIYAVAKYCDEKNINFNFIPSAIITNSETLLLWQRETIEKAFKCKIYDYYGTAEYVTFAAQCGEFAYHINPLIGIMEIVDKDGINVKNDLGAVVCTTLTNFSMPLIRYKIGDLGILTDESCECGCQFDILKRIEGRIDDVVITEDGKRIGRLDHIFKGVSGIKECQIIIEDMSNYKLKVVKGKDFENKQIDTIKSNLKSRVGANIRISVEFVSRIEKTDRGKFKGVINHSKP